MAPALLPWNVSGDTHAMSYISQHTYKPSDPETSIRQLNLLLRAELSAIETYELAVKKVERSDAAYADSVMLLEKIGQEHQQAADKLRERIRAAGGEPSSSAGIGGAFATVVQGAANLLGDTAALRGLKMSEEHGLRDYRAALDDVDEASRQLIQQRLIPAEQQHIAAIDRLMMAIGRA